MSLAETLRRNAEYVKAGGGVSTEPTGGQPTLIITDSSPELTGVIEPALGLGRGQACVIRIAGAWGASDGAELYRSVALALYLHDCREVYVVGHTRCISCPADRSTLRKNMNRAGLLGNLPDKGANLLNKIRGPVGPVMAVKETVELLRKTLVPEGIPVHGCMLDPDTGGLRIIDEDKVAAARPESIAPEAAQVEDLFLPDMPEITLPEIAPLDLDALTAQTRSTPAEAKPAFEYGATIKNTGPVSFSELQQMPRGQAIQSAPASRGQAIQSAPAPGAIFGPQAQLEAIEVPRVQFEIPAAVEIRDTGIAPAAMPELFSAQAEVIQPTGDRQHVTAREDIVALDSIESREDVEARKVIRARQLAKTRRQKKTPPAPRPRRARAERPAVTPIAPGAPAQRPLGEREISFGPDEEATPTAGEDIRVDIRGGYVNHRGSEFPLDPQLQRALVKIQQFLASEFSRKDRSQIAGRVRRNAASGQPVGEMLKLMIGPVLKLGKKRYAVINELLKIKEELPRQDPAISAAILVEILSGSRG